MSRHHSFQDRTKSRLTTYKAGVLGVTENGVWRRNQKPYSHILPSSYRQLNILPVIREAFWRWFQGQGIKLHSDFHHLNSSQALCFNLFFPLLLDDERHLDVVGEALGIAPDFSPGARFEFQPHEVEGTSFDFAIPRASGGHIYFEIKYTESRFGAASADERHLKKFKEIYGPRVAGRFEDPYCRAEGFLANYQVVRNIWHLNETADDLVVFLYPRENKFLRQQEGILRGCATQPYKNRVRVMYLEDLVSYVRGRVIRHSLQSSAIREFEAKYFPTPPAVEE